MFCTHFCLGLQNMLSIARKKDMLIRHCAATYSKFKSHQTVRKACDLFHCLLLCSPCHICFYHCRVAWLDCRVDWLDRDEHRLRYKSVYTLYKHSHTHCKKVNGRSGNSVTPQRTEIFIVFYKGSEQITIQNYKPQWLVWKNL